MSRNVGGAHDVELVVEDIYLADGTRIVSDIVPDSVMVNGLNIGPVAQGGMGSNLLFNGMSMGVKIPHIFSRPLPDPPQE
jgi:hypothetical protein